MHPEATRRRDGFLERGREMTRIEAFVDAAFAFAVTLLVISFDHVPQDLGELTDALKGTPAFAASFALVAMFWFAHHTWSRRYGLDDGVSVLLSLVLVFLVLVYVYPLRMLFGSFFAWLSWMLLPERWHVPWAFEVTGYADVRAVFVIYGVAWSTLGLVITALYHHAWRCREALGLDLEEQVATRMEIARWLWVPATGALSISAALLIPDDAHPALGGLPGMLYSLMAFTAVVMWLEERRARRRLAAPAHNDRARGTGDPAPRQRRRRRRRGPRPPA